MQMENCVNEDLLIWNWKCLCCTPTPHPHLATAPSALITPTIHLFPAGTEGLRVRLVVSQRTLFLLFCGLVQL